MLTRLPAGQAAVCRCDDDLDATLGRLREWLRKVGYTPLGPAFVTWDRHAKRLLHQPIAHVFAPRHSDEMYVIERREVLMLRVPMSVKAEHYNLAGVYDYALERNLEPLSAPFVPVLGKPQPETHQVFGYVPVLPRGTHLLSPHSNRLSRKIGWTPQEPNLGDFISARFIRREVGHSVARWLIIVLLGMILLLPWYWLLWYFRWMQPLSRGEFTQLGMFGMILIIGSGLILWRGLTNARHRWNRFWHQTPPPPLLLIDFEV